MIEGEIYFDRALDLQQREARAREKAELLAKEAGRKRE
jgi:hypothetical protein